MRRCAIAVDDHDYDTLAADHAPAAEWDTGRPGEIYVGREAIFTWQPERLKRPKPARRPGSAEVGARRRHCRSVKVGRP